MIFPGVGLKPPPAVLRLADLLSVHPTRAGFKLGNTGCFFANSKDGNAYQTKATTKVSMHNTGGWGKPW